MFREFNSGGIKIINSLTYAMLIVFGAFFIENILLSVFFQYEQMYNDSSWSFLTLIITLISSGFSFLFIFWIYRQSYRYLEEAINKEMIHFILSLYWIIIYIPNLIRELLQLFFIFLRLYNKVKFSGSDIIGIQEIGYRLFLVSVPLVFITIAFKLIKNSEYLKPRLMEVE